LEISVFEGMGQFRPKVGDVHCELFFARMNRPVNALQLHRRQ